eukprot:CAMPEP_0204310152 /NCGR_PEP_ID=MMETSP0469-20131031/1531_1 /ASSEMBLY_ACC=CAM_ASM_000384 /TAXON_ID=2969 /ORGANISM="Oxyrrhis marina" /LENGTH=234 /DNA_ID=CAMNT_0051289871 /DNA_START=6 /DNA_END=710 /DNA_ORIENTATION=+
MASFCVMQSFRSRPAAAPKSLPVPLDDLEEEPTARLDCAKQSVKSSLQRLTAELDRTRQQEKSRVSRSRKVRVSLSSADDREAILHSLKECTMTEAVEVGSVIVPRTSTLKTGCGALKDGVDPTFQVAALRFPGCHVLVFEAPVSAWVAAERRRTQRNRPPSQASTASGASGRVSCSTASDVSKDTAIDSNPSRLVRFFADAFARPSQGSWVGSESDLGSSIPPGAILDDDSPV